MGAGMQPGSMAEWGLPSLQFTTPCHHLQAPANSALTCLMRPLMSFPPLNARGNGSLSSAIFVPWLSMAGTKLWLLSYEIILTSILGLHARDKT